MLCVILLPSKSYLNFVYNFIVFIYISIYWLFILRQIYCNIIASYFIYFYCIFILLVLLGFKSHRRCKSYMTTISAFTGGVKRISYLDSFQTDKDTKSRTVFELQMLGSKRFEVNNPNNSDKDANLCRNIYFSIITYRRRNKISRERSILTLLLPQFYTLFTNLFL